MRLLVSIVLALILNGPLASGWAFSSNSSAELNPRSDTSLLFGGPVLSLKYSTFVVPTTMPQSLSPELPDGANILPALSDDSEQIVRIDGSPERSAVTPVPTLRLISKEEWSGGGLFGPKHEVRESWRPEDMEPRTVHPAGLNKKKSVRLGGVWPDLDVAYRHARSDSAPQPAYVAPAHSGADTVEAGMSFSRSDWTARVLSSYAAGEELWLNGSGTRERGHTLSGSYRFTDSVTVAPSLVYREVSQGWSAARTDIPSATLSLTYAPLRDLKLATEGSYSRTLSTDRLMDRDAYQIKTEMSLTARRSSSIETTLSIDAGYQNSKDRLSASGPLEDVSGFLRLRISGL
jgi:hypothetical protein